ncbi:glucose dehydrogenase [FAD, quinone]-like [Spodoptera litura]|uniref:Glucose dehydrogenase [FAD, quinone]-like n=1 Tax=Spodoptera litura TaxID=69820 RepID=A0A9J7IJI8_SPOLT|nr:glucose dehydrogenase [FAD, quinone]-like [Spodoptera litura]
MNSSEAVSYYVGVEQIFNMVAILNLTAYQWPDQACVHNGSEFDFIVVGGGSAGCIVASRLVKTGKASVLLIEAGPYPPLESDYEGLFPFLKDSRYDWNFTSTENELIGEYHTKDVIHMSSGKMLGGSSSLGFGCYRRGYPHDYNEWADITNDTSWSYKSIAPLFKKNEQLVDPRLLRSNHYYGTKGNIKIGKVYYKRNRPYFDALEELGYDYHLDVNPDHPLGFTNLMFTIGDDVRQTPAHKFLKPLKNNKKLHLLVNTLATKIIFDDNKTAVGVEILTEHNEKITVRARKEVIVTCGTIKSPQLLMLSGIGPKEELEDKNIDVIADLPVGKNFQDHVNTILLYKMTKSSLAYNLDNPKRYPFVIFDGYVAFNKSQCYPDYEAICVHFGETLTFLGICAFYFSYDNKLCDTINKAADNKEIFMTFVTYLNPKSRGEILLKSTDPRDNPLIIPRYYSNEIDIEKHASYLADFNRIVNTTYFKEVEGEFIDPQLKSCEGLKKNTMEYWKCYAIATADTAHYFVGTCSMGAVVNSRLQVYGVKNLRVCDASIMPTNVRALAEASVMAIARKASNMIIADNGLRK